MLLLLLQLGEDHYALETRGIVQVLPLVALKRVPRAPPGVAGLFDFRGVPVPVVDLAMLTLGRPAAQRLSTRVVLARYGSDGHLLGLIAEKATETLKREPGDFVDGGVRSDGAPWLGPVCSDARGLVQWVAVDRLLAPAVRDALFRPATEGA